MKPELVPRETKLLSRRCREGDRFIKLKVYTVFPLGVLYLVHLHLALDCVVIACSLEAFRPGLVQGCKDPKGVG